MVKDRDREDYQIGGIKEGDVVYIGKGCRKAERWCV